MRQTALFLSLGLCLAGCASSGAGRRDVFDERSGDFGAQPPALRAEADSCKPLLRYLDLDPEENKRHSCWHRVWEVPAALVAYPAATAVLLGVVTAPVWVPLLLLLR
jgi:hypothetical protein